MSLDTVEKNLLIFLDPCGEMDEASWRFVFVQNTDKASIRSVVEKDMTGNTIYCFKRNEIVFYLLFIWYLKKNGLLKKSRKVFYLNDGLLSSIFDAGQTVGYRAFASDHIPSPVSLRQRLFSLLPLFMRAEKKYLVINKKNKARETTPGKYDSVLKAQDFMFFSNASGKLIMTGIETLKSGDGMVLKTTSNTEYAEVMQKEFSTMRLIVGLQGKTAIIPSAGAQIRTKGNSFFVEEYIEGKTLREILHRLSRKNDIENVRLLLDRLDAWFIIYYSLFQGKSKPLSSCFRHLFSASVDLYGSNHKIHDILDRAREALAAVEQNHSGVITIVAHNDLWPGNFIVNKERLVAIDWERATPDRAPFFDYYWMIISAILEYHVCRIGVIDYSRAFRIFLEGNDAVSRYGAVKLSAFMERHGVEKNRYNNFLLLFLLEWSVQGYLAIGRQTAMDKLAFGELLYFLKKSMGND